MTTGHHLRPNRNLPPILLAMVLEQGVASSRKPSAASARRPRCGKTSPGARHSSARAPFRPLRTRRGPGIRAAINRHYPAGLEALAAIK